MCLKHCGDLGGWKLALAAAPCLRARWRFPSFIGPSSLASSSLGLRDSSTGRRGGGGARLCCPHSPRPCRAPLARRPLATSSPRASPRSSATTCGHRRRRPPTPTPQSRSRPQRPRRQGMQGGVAPHRARARCAASAVRLAGTRRWSSAVAVASPISVCLGGLAQRHGPPGGELRP